MIPGPSDLGEKDDQCYWQFPPPNAKALFLPTLGPMSNDFPESELVLHVTLLLMEMPQQHGHAFIQEVQIYDWEP